MRVRNATCRNFLNPIQSACLCGEKLDLGHIWGLLLISRVTQESLAYLWCPENQVWASGLSPSRSLPTFTHAQASLVPKACERPGV